MLPLKSKIVSMYRMECCKTTKKIGLPINDNESLLFLLSAPTGVGFNVKRLNVQTNTPRTHTNNNNNNLKQNGRRKTIVSLSQEVQTNILSYNALCITLTPPKQKSVYPTFLQLFIQ